MDIYIVNCTFNVSQSLTDCAFRKEEDAKAYAEGLNGEKAKAVAHCKELIARREGEAMVKFVVEENAIEFVVLTAELK